MRGYLLAIALILLPAAATARTVEAGSFILSGGLGPGFGLPTALGGSNKFLLIAGRAEYAVSKSFGIIGSLNAGWADTVPLKLRAGGKFRFTNLDAPISPYAELQLSFGRLYDVIGANLTTLGAFFGGGLDYFLTAKLSVGAELGFEFGSTLGERPAFCGVFEMIALLGYTF